MFCHFPILFTAKSSESRKRRESSAKANRSDIQDSYCRAWKEESLFHIFFFFWGGGGGSPNDNEYDPLIHGVQQVEGITYTA